jgi:hypothetical protein
MNNQRLFFLTLALEMTICFFRFVREVKLLFFCIF